MPFYLNVMIRFLGSFLISISFTSEESFFFVFHIFQLPSSLCAIFIVETNTTLYVAWMVQLS